MAAERSRGTSRLMPIDTVPGLGAVATGRDLRSPSTRRQSRSGREQARRPARRNSCAPGSLGRIRRERSGHAGCAGLPLEPVGRRPLRGQPGRREHVREGRDGGSRRPGAARPVGQGIRHRPRHDHAPRIRRTAAGRGRATPIARDDGRRDDGRSLEALRAGSGPAARVDRDALARVRERGPRGSHASRCSHRVDLVSRRPFARRRSRSATKPSGSTTSARASTCRSGSRSCSTRIRLPARCCSSVTASSRGGRRRRRPTRAPSSSSRELPRWSARLEPAGSVSAAGRARSSGRASASPSWRRHFLRSAARSSPTRTASCSRSTAARRPWPSPRRHMLPRSARSGRPVPTI